MAETTIEKLAEIIGLPVNDLVKQIVSAGLPERKSSDTISEDEQLQLLGYLNQLKGKKTQLAKSRQKKRTQLKSGKGQGSNVISVEVRGSRSVLKQKATPVNAAVEKAKDETASLDKDKSSSKEDQTEKKDKDKKQSVKPGSETPDKTTSDASEDQASDSTSVDKEVVKPIIEPPPKEPPPKEEKNKKSRKSSKLKKREQLHIEGTKRVKRKKIPRVISRPVKLDGLSKHAFEKPTKPMQREVLIPETISIVELAQRMAIKRSELIKILMSMDIMVTINHILDQETAMLIVEELGHIAKVEETDNTETYLVETEADNKENQQSRPPVVAVMGHVDHGKTSLLDHIRRSHVASDEAGGITQHIGAYHVETDNRMITFFDTPGHEAFTAMRARGAKITDIVILVVAADDGVMPQTVEAIEHSKAAGVPVIIAINKVDKEGADVEKIKGDLAKHGILSEEWGGDNIMVEVSAKTGQNISGLLEAILLQAEIMELKASFEGAAKATVIESSRDKARGVLVTILVRSGVLKRGDVLLAGTEYGKVRAILDENGKNLAEVNPSMPAMIFGMSGILPAGEELIVVDNERKAKEIAFNRREKARDVRLANPATSKEELFSIGTDEKKELKLFIRSDVIGTSEALRESIEKIDNDEIKIKILSNQVGAITASDVNLVSAVGSGIIIGFNVRADSSARKVAEEQGIPIRYYNIIYELLDDVKSMMSDLLSPEVREDITGIAAVKDVFKSSRLGTIAGCQVTEGAVKQGSYIRVLRDNIVVFEGELESLRRHKDDVSEVKSGTECGIGVKDYNDVKVNDQIEVYKRTEIRRQIT